MSKVKRILAVVLAMAMVMAMNIVSFADSTETSSITINNLTSDVSAVYVIPVALWDAEENKMVKADWVPEGAFSATTTNNEGTIDWSAIQTAAHNVSDKEQYAAGLSESGTKKTATKSGLALGIYTVIVDGGKSTYNPMGDNLFTYNENGEIKGRDVVISAKGKGYSVEKKLDDTVNNKVVGINGEVDFTIEATFPSFPDDKTEDRVFTITDEPIGMDIIALEVYVGGTGNDNKLTENVDYTVETGTTGGYSTNENARTIVFTSSYIDPENNKNAHATELVTVKVKAKINEHILDSGNGYSNSVKTNYGAGKTPVTGITGSILMKKYNEQGLTEAGQTEANLLSGAEFEVYQVVDGAVSTQALSFIKLEDGVYRLATEAEKTDTTKEVLTTVVATTGSVTVKGLDDGTYHFKETKAPEGYAINENGVDVTLNGTNETTNFTVNGYLTDTKLSALPSTGGAGIIVFTIVGCIIMIAAASMFFLSGRKKEE